MITVLVVSDVYQRQVKLRIIFIMLICLFQLDHCIHQDFWNVLTAVNTKSAFAHNSSSSFALWLFRKKQEINGALFPKTFPEKKKSRHSQSYAGTNVIVVPPDFHRIKKQIFHIGISATNLSHIQVRKHFLLSEFTNSGFLFRYTYPLTLEHGLSYLRKRSPGVSQTHSKRSFIQSVNY